MNRKTTLLQVALAGALALFVGHGIAQAQQAAGARQATNGKVRKAYEALAQMESLRATIQREKTNAEKKKDTVKQLCLDDKLNQLNKSIDTAKTVKEELEAALAATPPDTDLAESSAQIISALASGTKSIQDSANKCIGKESSQLGESSTSMTVSTTMPSSEEIGSTEVPELRQPPVCTSCSS
jgi:hypothetical protein